MHDEKKLRQISEVVLETLKQDFDNIEFIEAKVHYDVDFEGDDILRIEVVFKGSPKKIDTTGLSSVVRHIRPKLKAIEEQAFPLFSFISDKEIKGMRVAAS